MSLIFVPPFWRQLIHGDCALELYEPGISILSLMLKISATLLAGLLASVFMIIINFKKTYENVSKDILAAGSFSKSLSQFGLRMLLLIAFIFISLSPVYNQYGKNPSSYIENPFSDLIEDIACFGIALTTQIAITALFFYGLYAFSHSKFSEL